MVINYEIEGLNCLDETSPYGMSPFTLKTNQTNGIVNSAFANHVHQMDNTVYSMTAQNPILAVGLFGAYKEITQLKLAESQANLQVAQFNRDSGRA